MSVLEDFATVLADISASRVGVPERKLIAAHCLDSLGALFAGSLTAEGEEINRLAEDAPTPLFGGTLADRAARRAATIRSTEIDDIHMPSCTTPSSVVVATGLTLASGLRVKDAGTLFAALAAGYTAFVRFGLAIDGPIIVHKGVWPTCLLAPIGAAAVTAKLLGLNAAQIADALAIALVQANGNLGGKSPRWLMLGLATRTGIASALAAKAGFVGDRQMLDLDWWPRSRELSLDSSRLLFDAGRSTTVDELSYKPYCAAKQTIAAIDAFRALLAADLSPSAIAAITVRVPPAYQRMIAHHDASAERVGRITSVAYHLALAAHCPAELDNVARPDLTHDARVRELMAIVKVEEDESLTSYYPRHWPALIEVTTNDGRVLKKLTVASDGDPELSFDWNRVVAKFRRLAVPVVGQGRADEIVAGYFALPSATQLDTEHIEQTFSFDQTAA